MDDRVQGIARQLDADPAVAGALAFGPFRLHIAQRRIEKDGSPLHLSARALDILAMLVEQAGTVVSKNELMTRVWPGAVVDESSLRVHVAALRKALGDGEASARYLATVSGQGYCFVAKVSRADGARPSIVTPASAKVHSLPARPSQMVGRDQTVDEISDRLTSKRFVTIVGPGGIGKTTVAVSTGHALLTQFAGQVHFIDFGAIRDPALVPSIVASVLGLPSRSSDPSDSLVAFLRGRRLLLILDCCEPVIEASAALAERLYKEAPQLHILATSRELLRVEGEHIHRLLPLASPPERATLTATSALAFSAIELFVERATAGGGEFALTDANASDVGDICRRLDGIALAIELAASRVCAYGVKPMIELLDNQFNLLWEGRRTALPRHRTLRATIEWSYNLLSEPERVVLCRLSVFLGNFSLEAARAVVGTEEIDDDTVMATLASLVAKSMLVLNTGYPSSRYRLLDATRAFVQEKLAAGADTETVARRHASYFLRLLEKTGDKSNEDLSTTADQFGNIRAALTWCFSDQGDRTIGVALTAASIPLFFRLSLLAECKLWVTRAIESFDRSNGNPRHELILHAGLGLAQMLTGGITDEIKTSLIRALQLAKEIDDVPSQLSIMDRLHLLYVLSGSFDDALNIARSGEAIAAGNRDFAALARMQTSLSISCHLVGDVPASRTYIEAALSHSPAVGPDLDRHLNPDVPNRAQITLARILWLQGYPDRAMEVVRRAIDGVIAVDHPVKLCRALLLAFAVFYWNSEAADFEDNVDRILLEARRHGLDVLQAVGQGVKGVVLAARGRTREGSALMQDSVEKLHDRKYGPQTDFGSPLAEALARTGQYDEALQTIDGAIARAQDHNFMMEMADMLRVKAEVLISAKHPDTLQAEHCLRHSLDLARRQGALGFELRSAVSLARLRSQQGHRDDARGILAPVYGRFTEGFNTRWLAAAREFLDELNSAGPRSAAIN
jgi:predicted ATPase/DNA-binding winged helix-turn-helix (wHTH) protein